jgi:aspartyl-tRNA(Asn)/glutamyl-tRNA(Gln) amidotransferase subunit B
MTQYSIHNTQYDTVIGLEVHLQLGTRTKAFCGCSTRFGSAPNSQTCPVCLGLPGSLPVLNKEAFDLSLKVALALNCTVQDMIKFDRKNYYYPDLPKNFQISQYDMPLSYNGSIDVVSAGTSKRIRVKRVHLEEDAGKLLHSDKGYSMIDYNRSGIPLLEIVTEPDIASPQEAYDYLVKLKATLRYLRVSDCDMEKGSLRCDANISLKAKDAAMLGTKVELKNMNTFKGVRSALEFEVRRQTDLLEDKGVVVQQTRLWNPDKQVTVNMRTKEEAEDYRYFPEPDLVPFVVDKLSVSRIKDSLPELPDQRKARFVRDLGLSEYDASVLTDDVDTADYFETCAKLSGNAKVSANWIMGDMTAIAKDKNVPVAGLGVRPEALAGIIDMMAKGILSGKMAKDVLAEAIETKNDPDVIVKRNALSQITDNSAIEAVVKAVIARESRSVADYKSGKSNAFMFLVGQVMRETKGKANPAIVNELLKKELG